MKQKSILFSPWLLQNTEKALIKEYTLNHKRDPFTIEGIFLN